MAFNQTHIDRLRIHPNQERAMATAESLLSAAKQLSEVQQRKVAALVGAVVADAAGKQ